MTHKNDSFFRRRRSTVGTVTETGAIVWNSGGKKLWISCWEGDFDTVKFYVDHGEKFNLPQFYHFFPQSKIWAKPGLKFRNNSRSQIESDLVKLNFGFEPQ